MKRLYVLSALLALCLSLGTSAAHAQDPLLVTLPDTSGFEVGDIIEVPVTLEDALPESPVVIAIDIAFVFDGSIVSFTGNYSTEGTILASSGNSIIVNAQADSIAIGVTNTASEGITGGPGVILYLEAEIVGTGATPLTFTTFMFNGGTPASTTQDGSVTVGEANEPPTVDDPIGDQTLEVNGPSFEIDLTAIFSDPDGDPLTFTAESGNEAIVTAGVTGSQLTVTPLAVGATTVTVTAADGNGGTAETVFNVTVDPVVADLVINEVDYDQPGTDDAEFIELANVSGATINLGVYTLELVNGDGDVIYETIDLSAEDLAPGDYFVVCDNPSEVPGCDLDARGGATTDLIQNGEPGGDAIGLLNGDVLVDALSYEGAVPGYTEGSPAVPGDNNDGVGIGLSRFPDGFDSDNNDADFVLSFITPGEANTDNIPVELASFTAQADGPDAVLTWTTLSETNNLGFYVQQKIDGAFEKIGFEEGAGTTTETTEYRFPVRDLDPGTYVFRLRQEDRDGTYAYSEEKEVEIAMTARFQLSPPSPNPFYDHASFTLRVKDPQHVTVALYNVLGQRVGTLHDGPLTEETLRLEAAGLSSGLYLIRIVGETFQETRRVTLVR